MAKEFPDDATSAAVIGCGPVGLMAILAAQAQGAEKVSSLLLLPDLTFFSLVSCMVATFAAGIGCGLVGLMDGNLCCTSTVR